MRKRYRAIVTVGASVLIAACLSAAGLAGGLEDLFKNPSKYLEAPGRLVDDVIRAPSDITYGLFFKETHDKFEKTLATGVAAADSTLSKHEAIVDSLLKQNEHVLSGYLGDATARLGEQLTSQVLTLATELKTQRAALTLSGRVVGIDAITFLFVILGVCASIFALCTALWSGRPMVLPGTVGSTGGVGLRSSIAVAIALVAVASGLLLYRAHKIAELTATNQASLARALSSLHFAEAKRAAAYLDAIQSDEFSNLRLELTELLWRVLTEPWTYQPGPSADQTLSKIRQLEAEYQAICGDPGKLGNPYAYALDAFVAWQISPDRYGEFKAAMAAEQALRASELRASSGGDSKCRMDGSSHRFPLSPLVATFLSEYLTQPISSHEWGVLKLTPPVSLEQLQMTLSRQNKLEAQQSDNPLDGLRRWGEINSTLVRTTLPAYAVLAYSDAMAAQQPSGKVKYGYIAAAFDAASRIINAYDSVDPGALGYVEALASTEFTVSNARLSSLKTAHALYYRAWRLRLNSSKCLDPSVTRASYDRVLGGLIDPKAPPPEVEAFSCDLPAFDLITDATTRAAFAESVGKPWDAMVTTRIMRRYLQNSMRPYAFDALNEENFLKLKVAVAELRDFEAKLKSFLVARAKHKTIPQHSPQDDESLQIAFGALADLPLTSTLFIEPTVARTGTVVKDGSVVPLVAALTSSLDSPAIEEPRRKALLRQVATRNMLLR